MQTYASKKKSTGAAAQSSTTENISKSDMLRMSGAGAPQPMSAALREKFEPGFGADFSNIRISRGHIPEEMGVQAVAKGTDILIDSRAGMDVLGHELAHVVQQAQGQVQGGFPVVHDAALEHEADVMGARAASGMNAMEGGMSGFGGTEMMSIAPMSDASAPAQCKSRAEKKAEKAEKSAQADNEDAILSDYGQALRADVNKQSAGITADTPTSQLLTGNRLNYMRANKGDVARDRKKELQAKALKGASTKFANYLSKTSAGVAQDIYGDINDGGAALNSTGKIKTALRINPSDPKALEAQAKENQTALGDIQTWLGMVEQDPRAMRHFGATMDKVYKPMGSFDAQTNKGGIVGGEKHAGIYALNDMYLRGTGGYVSDISQKSSKLTKGDRNPMSVRSQLSQGLLNRVFAKTGDLDSMDETERSAYDMLMNFSDKYGGQQAAPAQTGWKKANVSDAAYSKAPNQMAGAQRDPMNKLKKLGFY